MKNWIILLLLVLILVLAAGTSKLWLKPALDFIGAKSDTIQGLADVIQILLWLGAVVIFVVSLMKRKKKKETPESIHLETHGDRSVSIPGVAKDSIIITGDVNQVNIDKKNHGDVTALRNAYLSHVFKTTKHLSLAGIDPKAASEAETRLDLNAVYTALMTMSTEAHELWQHGKQPERETQYISALEQLNRNSHLVLLGDPGSGKSTFVNFVALCLSGEALQQPEINLSLLTAPIPQDDKEKEKSQQWHHGALIPIRVILRDFAARGLPAAGTKTTARHLWDFIATDLTTATLGDYADPLRQELLKKGGLLLLDGLDEVPEADKRRNQIKEAVEDFAAAYARCRILVTSRTYAYQKQDWRLPDFSETILAPFSKGQIQRFIDRWYSYIGELRGLNPDDARGRAELLKRAVFASDRLQALAERPLLLTLMASLHAWRGGSLPERREQLYADTVDLLLDWWESPKTVRDAEGKVKVLQPSLAEWLKVDRQRVRDLLNELAFGAHESQPELVGTADIAEKDLVSGMMCLSQNPDVKPARLIEYLSQRAGLLLPRGVGVYTFPHRTFQEYLAACYLTDHDYPDKLAELLRGDPNRWREVALLAGAKAARGAASTIWLLVDALCYKDVKEQRDDLSATWCAHLAGQAIVETADLKRLSESNQKKVERIKNWLTIIIRQDEFPAIERAAAGDTLARLGDPRTEVMSLNEMQFCFVPKGPFWMGSDEYDWEKPFHQNDAINYDYWISRYPITNAQFQFFVDAKDGYINNDWWTKDGLTWRGDRKSPDKYGGVFDLPNHPVVYVRWHEAVAFTCWLTAHLRQQRILPEDWEIRLPSEAEWEKAARGGITIVSQSLVQSLKKLIFQPPMDMKDNDRAKRRYPWGDDPDPNRANYDETKIGTTSAVGCFPGGASPYGCEDLSGNVWEWCSTIWRENYKQKAADQLECDRPRVVRGGSFVHHQGYVRCASRYWHDPGSWYVYLGFRVVLSP